MYPCNRIYLVSLTFALLCLLPPVSLARNDAARIIIVLDASGSMWGKIQDRTKIEIAREVIAGLTKDWDPTIELGLMAYGHRREGDCKDIELLVPVSKTDPARIVRTVNAIQPKGMTPLSDAVKQAAEVLDYKRAKATVILVSDGVESCNADPCAVGAALKKAGADFTAHVVGFGVKKEERTGLACLAKNTGGQFFAAKDASELKAALITAVKQAKQSPNVTIIAVPRRGAKPFASTNYVSIHPLGPDGKPVEKQITGDHGNPTRFALPAGRYQARVKVGKGIAQAEFEVKPEKTTELTVVVGVGKVRITAIPKPGAKPFKTTNYVSIFPIGPDGKPAPKQLTGNNGNPTEFTLPAGHYRTEVTVGKGVAHADFEVKPEEMTPITVVVGVGTVRLTFVPKKGATPFPSTSYVSIYPIGPDGKPAEKQITGYYGNPVTFTLPAGRYQVKAKVKENWSPSEIEIRAGDDRDIEIAVPKP